MLSVMLNYLFITLFAAGVFHPYVLPIKVVGSLPIQNDRGVYGVACIADRVYVVVHDLFKIQVFQNTPPFTELPSIVTPELRRPNDMGACKKQNCLYVSDSNHGCVWKIELSRCSSAREITKDWVKVVNPHGLSVAANGWVVIVTRHPNLVNVYRQDGRLVKEISLSQFEIENPHQALLTKKGSFIIGSGDDKNEPHKVYSIVDDKIMVSRKIKERCHPHFYTVPAELNGVILEGNKDVRPFVRPPTVKCTIMHRKLTAGPRRSNF